MRDEHLSGDSQVAPYSEAPRRSESLAESVTFAIINQNGETYLPATLQALLALHPECKVLLIDDGSTDGTFNLVQERFPQVEWVDLGPNTGRIGRARKRAVETCETPYLLIMDNDITFAPQCIPMLLRHLREHPRAMSCRPRLVYADRPGVIYQDANTLHYLALAADQRRDRPVEEGLSPFPRQTVGGGIMLLNCEIARQAGNFDENYLFGWSDLELDVRARLLGFATLQHPRAIGYHIERPGGLQRVVGQLYNRRRLIAICYSARSLAVFGPALLLFEVIVLLMCLASGYRREYLHAARLLWADAADIRARRTKLQSARVYRRDDVVLGAGRISITGRMSGSRLALRLAPLLSAMFGLYWRMARPLARERTPRAPAASSDTAR